VNQINFGSVTGNGAGQTIAIIDAYYDPNIASDLKQFDAQYGLQSPASFTQYVENGLRSINSGWALETALDVEWAHAIAPAANIVLVEAQPDLNDLFSAVSFASNLPGVSVVSMSWGAGEFAGESSYDNVFTTPAGHNGVTFVASSGDSGTTEYPSSSPNVLSVGGTTLTVTSQGNFVSETAWSQSGTGSSPYESQPSWQTGATGGAALSTSGRTTPDVAFDGDPNTGVSVYDSVPVQGRAGWFTVGGTSVGAPSWAGLIAITDQGLALNGVGSLSTAQASLYQVSSADFNHPATGSTTTNFALGTGLGSPKANLVVSSLVQLNTPTTSTTTAAVTTAKGASSVVNHMAGALAIPTDPTATGSGFSQSTTSLTGVEITALVPSTTSTSTTPTLVTIIIVPAPIPPVAFHLGSSSSPVTAQIVNSPLAASEEQPTSFTLFGQALETELQKPFKVRLGPQSNPQWLIDVVEPFQPLDPAEAPKADPILGPGSFGIWPNSSLMPSAIDAIFESQNGGLFPLSSGDFLSLVKRRGGAMSDSGFSTFLGAAVVAAGGYHLAMRESQRFKTRWLPSRAGSNLPLGRWPGFRGR
jgi:subtilase family serine protease